MKKIYTVDLDEISTFWSESPLVITQKVNDLGWSPILAGIFVLQVPPICALDCSDPDCLQVTGFEGDYTFDFVEQNTQ